ncbi:MAG: AEC family transporter, partial [Pseudomonadota bacterium]
TNTLSLLGQLAIPLMLITLGTAVARLTPANIRVATAVALAKAALCIAVGWGIATAFALPPTAFGILVLQIAAPAAVTSYLIAVKYKADAQAVAGLVVMSTLLSVIILPLILALVL